MPPSPNCACALGAAISVSAIRSAAGKRRACALLIGASDREGVRRKGKTRRGHERAEMFRPTDVTQRIEPRDGPRRLMRLGECFDRTTGFVDRRAGETGQKRQG